jgi:DNA repair photolyase
MKVVLIKLEAKEIFTKTKLPGAEWAINQYVGCEHACLYCYAKFIQRWRPKDYGKWGGWIEAKINAPELVKGRYVDGWAYMSSISDPYSEIEKELELTKRVLENLDKRIKLSIQTKSDLVLRDINIFKQFKTIEVGLTINSFEGKSKEIFEPSSSSNEKRIRALRILKENDIKTFAFISPIIPGLIDLKKVIEETKEYASYYFFEFLNMRAAGIECIKAIKDNFPESYNILMDKKRYLGFIKESEETIALERINIKGIETHCET